jgi:CubicO group peptidase (beta-lactamase class C family)
LCCSDHWLRYGQFNGVALAAEDGKVVFEKAFGYANMEWKIPNTKPTVPRGRLISR